jgi:ubiquinone/menaquinone biosynthesis C-methylase UbiE
MAKTGPFEEHSDDYEKWFDLNKHAYQSELKAIRHFIPENGQGVEIGIGSGLFAQPLGIKKGIDPSEQMRLIASGRGLDVENGVAENVPLNDNTFDYALLVTTICFVDDIRKSLKEVRRILKPGGRIIIGFVDKNSPIGKVYLENKQFSTFYKDAVFYSAEEIETELKAAGFQNMEFVQTLFGKLKEINKVQPFQEGYGKGSFVVAKGEKSIRMH